MHKGVLRMAFGLGLVALWYFAGGVIATVTVVIVLMITLIVRGIVQISNRRVADENHCPACKYPRLAGSCVCSECGQQFGKSPPIVVKTPKRLG